MSTLFIGLLVAACVVALITVWLIWRARKPMPISTVSTSERKNKSLKERLLGLVQTLDYIGTRREWRYREPWVLLLGEQGAGKSSLAASLSPHLRRDIGDREKRLHAKGCEWHFLHHGVLIDTDGKLANAPADSKEAREWTATLVEISDQRPERAIDSIVVVVSAPALASASAETRDAMADRVYRQLYQVQERFEFLLPVYVVVSQCDGIDGYAAYWQALGERDDPASRNRRQLVGWSAPAVAEGATPKEWAEDAMDAMYERLKTLQLDTAAESDQIADADRFFLFPRHFQQLRDPLGQWLSVVFRGSAWHPGFYFRGVYFTGSSEANGQPSSSGERCTSVEFVDALIDDKVLAEPMLARPARTGVWSRNRVIRKLQVAGIVGFLLLCVGLVWSTVRLQHQVQTLKHSLEIVERVSSECASTEQVYALIRQMTRIDTNLTYLAIPVSWFDGRATSQSARYIAEEGFNEVIMPSISCYLGKRAQHLFEDSQKSILGNDSLGYFEARDRLESNLKRLIELETNLSRFEYIEKASSPADNPRVMKEFADLARYAYGKPLPDEVRNERGAFSAALAAVQGDLKPPLPQAMRTQLAREYGLQAELVQQQLQKSVQAGGQLLESLQAQKEPILQNTRDFTQWLSWIRSEWLQPGKGADPCARIQARLRADFIALEQRNHDYAPLFANLAQFDENSCTRPAMTQLADMQLPPYGLLFTQQGSGLLLNPALEDELLGLSTLVNLNFMQVVSPRPFQCLSASVGWRPAMVNAATNYVAEYQRFKAKQPKDDTLPDYTRPMYDRLARRALQNVLDDTLRQAQLPASSDAMLTLVSSEALSQADAQLARESEDMSHVVDPLLGVLRLYEQLGFTASGAQVTQCARDYAADSLARVDALASQSRLYDPTQGPLDGQFFALGSTPVVKDYLARQVSRGGVLAGYAQPFVVLLQNAGVVDESQRANPQTAEYWTNTIGELNRYVQFKEPNGQVGHLDDLFLKQFETLSYENCRKTLADYKAPEYGNDLFSIRRQALEQKVTLRCKDQRQAAAAETWGDFAERFNRELAGRYPFGPLTARDASLATVKRFFVDYDAQRAKLEQLLDDVPVEHLQAANGFLDGLDAANDFFKSTLTAGDVSLPVQLDLAFRAQTADATGSEQLLNWTMTSGERQAGFPNRNTNLPWPWGQVLVLDLQWADRSVWRPFADARQPDLTVDGQVASFVATGDWALLRMIRSHAPRGVVGRDPTDPTRLLLEFNVPTANPGQPDGRTEQRTMRAYLGVKLSGVDPKTKAAQPLTLPANFPQRAPLLWR
ncbi:type VI secretion system protein [Chitinolyticbacter meiyuanensis]|uniref:type VI secretion system protein n=1 Tax=Chitinolyticbacter meiyuanensis TaxID=682798 RepID=UPI0011E5CE29|nr:type VI secretion system protein [Chitinolyticbacter meiyuanensis]